MSRMSAYERLAEKVEKARLAAASNPAWGESLDILRERAGADSIKLSGWKNPYPAGDPRSLLLEYQFKVFHDKSRFKACLQARQTGKDFTNEGEAVTDCFERPGTDWMVAAPSERQALDSLDQAKLWAEAYDLTIADYVEAREGSTSQTLLKSAELKFANGSRIRAVPGKPDTVRGRSANILLTEFDFFENPQATWRAILPSITNPLRGGLKKVRLATTPNGKGGAMYRIWTKEDSARMQWSRHLVTIYHAVLMGLPVDWRQIKEAMDDAEGWAQEFELEWLDGSNVLLPYEIIALAESIEATEVIGMDFWEQAREDIVLGIDFGRSNDPTVCWALGKTGPVWTTREVLALKDTPTPEQEEILRVRIRKARRVCLDYTGPGIGLGDYLVKEFGEYKPSEHKFGKIELCTFTAGFKRHIFPRFRRAFESPVKIRVPISVTVREDLHDMRQVIKNGEYSYSAPRTAEGHSDRCTAGALAWNAVDNLTGPFRYSNVSKRDQDRERRGRRRKRRLKRIGVKA